ncbi:MAG: MATE family efflux transporter, partial [Lachnospiraceae bacterium]|nr:MATE family efflux transporter [Lachnospiraceae bacterium]
MNEQNRKMELLGSAPMPKALLALGLPTMVGMLINALYNLVDTYFVGGLGTDQMGAITVAYPLGQVVVGLGLLFGNGAAAYLSRLLGRGDRETADRVASTALYSSVFSGAIVILCSVIFLKPILKQLGAIDSVMPYALTYTSIYIVFSIFNVFNVTMNNIVSSEGSAKTAMCALMAGAVLNVVLDPVCIYWLDLGVTGAAIATAVSQIFSTLVYTCYIFRKKSLFHFHIKGCCFTKEIMSEILKIGIPTLIFQLLTSLSVAMINGAATEYGGSALAAMGPVTKIMSMGSLVVFGFLKGFQPIAGFSYGSRKYEGQHAASSISIIWSTRFCVSFGRA